MRQWYYVPIVLGLIWFTHRMGWDNFQEGDSMLWFGILIGIVGTLAVQKLDLWTRLGKLIGK